MATSPREIKRRITSITNTKKITKAMEMVSAAKMRKSVERVQKSKEYAETAWSVAKRLSSSVSMSVEHPLTIKREMKKVAIVVISGNKGLCGQFNRDVVNSALERTKECEKIGAEVEFITLGKKCGTVLASRKKNIVADYKKEDVTTSVEEIDTLYKMLVKDFVEEKYDRIYMAYTDFKSSMKQVPTTLRLLPIKKYEDEHLGHVGEDKAEIDNKDKDVDYTFEPNPEAVLTELYPRLLSIQLYQGLLESNACEHSARMMAMKNANEAAGEMVDSLNLLYNRARQASITQEIAEISAGRLALS